MIPVVEVDSGGVIPKQDFELVCMGTYGQLRGVVMTHQSSIFMTQGCGNTQSDQYKHVP